MESEHEPERLWLTLHPKGIDNRPPEIGLPTFDERLMSVAMKRRLTILPLDHWHIRATFLGRASVKPSEALKSSTATSVLPLSGVDEKPLLILEGKNIHKPQC
jgi:hypothetical protein